MWKAELEEILEPIHRNPRVQMMKKFVQHGNTSTFEHCQSVAETCDRLNERFRLGADRRTLILSAMLHDFYLYDWHGRPLNLNIFKMHGFTHPGKARDNAIRYFSVDKDIQKVIESHMWPLTLRSFPSSKEAMIVCMADKYCALKETFNR